MSFHILHVTTHGSLLSASRGHLLLKTKESEPSSPSKAERSLALEDIRAVIIAARGVTLTSSALAGILQHDGIILHCNQLYEPAGVTAPLSRVVDLQAFLNQVKRPIPLNRTLWHALLRIKTLNQQAVLSEQRVPSPYLERVLHQNKPIDEGNAARKYWQRYFPAIGWSRSSRDKSRDDPPNRMLNYGYAVLATLCHRAILVHGLCPTLGIHHAPRYRSAPLVYDIMEPFRPIVDKLLADFLLAEDQADFSQRAWMRAIGLALRDHRVHHRRYSLKLMDAIEKTASSLSRSYAVMDPGHLWLPQLQPPQPEQ